MGGATPGLVALGAVRKLASSLMVVHTFGPSTREAEASRSISDFKASLVYIGPRHSELPQ